MQATSVSIKGEARHQNPSDEVPYQKMYLRAKSMHMHLFRPLWIRACIAFSWKNFSS